MKLTPEKRMLFRRWAWACLGLSSLVFVLAPRPYEPACRVGGEPWSHFGIEMAPDYEAHLKSAFQAGKVLHSILGNTILIHRWGDEYDGRFQGLPPIGYIESNVQIDIAQWIWANPGAVSPLGYVHLHPRKYETPQFLRVSSLDGSTCNTILRNAIDAASWRRATAEEMAHDERVPFPPIDPDLERWRVANQRR